MKNLLLLPVFMSACLFLFSNESTPTLRTGPVADCPGIETHTSEGSVITYSPIEESMYLARVVKGKDTTFVTTIRVSGLKALKKPKGAKLHLYHNKPVKLDGELDYHIQDGKYIYTYTAILDRATLALLCTDQIKALLIDDYKEDILKKKSERFQQYALCLLDNKYLSDQK